MENLEPDFGIFNCLFDNTYYLTFLNLYIGNENFSKSDLKIGFDLIDNIINSNPIQSVCEGIDKLLKEDNWRPHLVAIITILKLDLETRNNYINPLWTRISNSSWVCPQILVAISLIDKDFENKAKNILTNGIKINFSYADNFPSQLIET